jgi:hypothetical protein
MSNDEGEQIKEVYAQFGLAVYYAQVLEHALVNALVYLDLIPSLARRARTRAEWEKEFDSFLNRHFETTLGKMIRNLSSVTAVPSNLEAMLREALAKRNWLAHEYFRERAEQFMSMRGREKMLTELQEVQTLFDGADRSLDEVVRPLREKYGITDEKVAQVTRELLARARADG